jgi:exodeoxyribonuclease-1
VADLSFLWLDYETFGLSPKRDRPAQFAAIRTDAQLNVIGEPINLHCRLAADYLPDPVSCLLTGITPQHCQAVGLSEAEFAKRIEAELAKPGTIGVGYNTIRFDDEFTRYLFWRNLIDPYAREWQNNCGRWDILDMVRTVYALRPDSLTWPLNEEGKVSFKLEYLSASNALVHDAAHDALSDVWATLGLARLIKERQPKLFDFCLGLRRRDRVLAEIKWPLKRPFLHVSGRFPAQQGCLGVMWPLAQHPRNRNEIICWDLAHDPNVLASLSPEDIQRRLFAATADLPEGLGRLAIKSVHLNKSPVVIGNPAVLPTELAAKWGLDLALAFGAHATAAAQLDLPASLWEAVYAPYSKGDAAAPADVDEDLYNGFASNDDRRRLQQLSTQDPAKWAQRPQAFEDERFVELALRYRARNFPQTLSETEAGQWANHCKSRLSHPPPGVRGWENYHATIETLRQDAPSDKLPLLDTLSIYQPA